MSEEDPILPRSDQDVIGEVAAVPPELLFAAYSHPLTTAQVALYTGWTLASLYEMSAVPPAKGPYELPSARELGVGERRNLGLVRLRHLLRRLADTTECSGSGLPTDVAFQDATDAAFRNRLEQLNLQILQALAIDRPNIELAYELGRSLRDTVNPPQDRNHTRSRADALAAQLRRERIVKWQQSLVSLSTEFPSRVAGLVTASLGRWSEFAAVTVGTKPRLKRWQKRSSRDEVATELCRYLLPQGDLWLMYLIGARTTAGLLTSESYVAAAEGALHRSSEVIRHLLRHYWAVMALVGAALVVVLYLTAANLGGAAKVWTSIAAIAGSLGISARTVDRIAKSANVMGRLAAEAERPIYVMSEDDAMVWAMTTLPPVRLTRSGVRQLRKAGIAGTAGLGRI